MRRRDFIALGGAAAVWPLAAHAQQPADRVRRIAVVFEIAENHPEGPPRIGIFLRTLRQLGWSDGGNTRIDTFWNAGNADRSRKYAAEMAAFAPDVILAASSPAVTALRQATKTVPIVFLNVADPVGGGFVDSLARPGGNLTGFALFEYSMSAKWIELLTEIVPGMKRVAVLRDRTIAAGAGQFDAIEAVAKPLRVELSGFDVRDAAGIERDISVFAHGANSGLIVTGSPLLGIHRELIIELAARHGLPAVYPYRHFVTGGGLISYGPDMVDQYRRAASYVDRILRGEKPADLPVQLPIKFETLLNLKTAKALGINVPTSILLRADEVLE